jgi:hypothetical protein
MVYRLKFDRDVSVAHMGSAVNDLGLGSAILLTPTIPRLAREFEITAVGPKKEVDSLITHIHDRFDLAF